MAVPLSAAAKQRVADQRRQMGSRLFVDMRTLVKSTFRALPVDLDVQNLAVAKVTVFGRLAKTIGTPSPKTFGQPCPIDSLLAQMLTGMSKEQRQSVTNIANMNYEYSQGVIDRSDPQSVDAPIIHILPNKKAPYDYLLRHTEDGEGDNITDAYGGRDFVIGAEGTGNGRRYTVIKMGDPSPLHPEQDVLDAILAKWATFDLPSYVLRKEPDWKVLGEIHQALSGQPLDMDRWSAVKDVCAQMAEAARSVVGDEDEEDPALAEHGLSGQQPTRTIAAQPGFRPGARQQVAAPVAAQPLRPAMRPPMRQAAAPVQPVVVQPVQEPIEVGIDPAAVVIGETWVEFTDGDGNTQAGYVGGEQPDDAGDVFYKIVVDNDVDNPWDVYPADLTEVAPPAEPEPEPVVAAAPPVRRGPVRSAPVAPAAAPQTVGRPTAPRPAAQQVKAVAPKVAAAPVKAAPKVVAKAPVKPVATASAAIRNRLTKK